MKYFFGILISIGLCLGVNQEVALAHIPPSQFILGTWLNKHNANTKSVKIRSNITAYEKNSPTAVHFREIMIFNSTLLSYRSLAVDDLNNKLYFVDAKPTEAPPIVKFLLSTDLPSVSQSLKEKGIPIRTQEELLAVPTEPERIKLESEYLVRWENDNLNMLAWIIGGADHAKDSLDPQVWFVKDAFIPLKLTYRESRDNENYDFRFEDFRSSKEYYYPRTINVLKKGEGIIFSVQLIDISLFPDTVAAKQLVFPQTDNGRTDFNSSPPSALKTLVQRYYGILR